MCCSMVLSGKSAGSGITTGVKENISKLIVMGTGGHIEIKNGQKLDQERALFKELASLTIKSHYSAYVNDKG